MSSEHPKRRPILGILAIFVLFFLYRVFTVYTVRSGECRPKPVDSSLRLLTRDERRAPVSFPERINYPNQERPLVVMTYNLAGDFNADPSTPEIRTFRRLNAAQIAGEDIGPTQKQMGKGIDYIFVARHPGREGRRQAHQA
jgi:hypothetical protein